MAINVYEKLNERSAQIKSSCSKSSNLSSCLLKLDYTADGSTTSSKNDFQNKKSPYLKGDKVQLHSRVTERKFVCKKTDLVSSFPLAVNIYRANSDQFKVLKRDKKTRKSVLTIPNEPAPAPQICTVSDVNDSEYFNESKDERKMKPRKKRTIRNDKKPRKGKNVDVYDRDARYCSQLDIDLDSSSTDFISQFTGDGKKQTRRKVPVNKTEISAHDVWAILRNLNQFQFVPSPPMSQDSLVSVKKKTNKNKIRSSCRDARLIETCRTEKFAFISNFVDKNNSQSSIDRITVIDKKDNYQELCKGIEKSVNKCKSTFHRPNQKKTKLKATRKLHRKTNNLYNIGNNRLQVNQKLSNDNCITEKDQRNEIVGLKIENAIQKSNHPHNNQDDICNVLNSSQTFITEKTNRHNTQDEKKIYKNKSKMQINGITKVVFSKGNNVENKKTEILTKTSDLVSVPFVAVTPTFIAQEVQTSDVNENLSQKLKSEKLINHNYLKAVNKWQIKPDKLKRCSPNAPSIKNRTNEDTKLMFKNNVVNEVEPEFKQKRQLKDKMLKFLYKKHQGEDDKTQEITRTEAKETLKKPVEVGTNTQIDIALFKDANQLKVNVTEIEKTLPISRRNRTKGKWASDFIDSVIKKIRSGVYYNKEKPLYKGNCNERKDSSQTDINFGNRCIQLNYPKYTGPHYLKGEELLPLPSHNSAKIKREIINNNHVDKELLGTDDKLHRKSKFHVQTSKRRSKNDNFKDIVYNTHINLNESENKKTFKQNETVKDLSKAKQSWVEGKWASDFIDNIFKKIKSGVYYSQEEHCLCKRYPRIKDDSSQTDNHSPNWNYDQINELDSITDKSLIHESLMLIPGFENTSNELEIETFSKNQIAVKNCITNIVVQFDVVLPSDPCQALQLEQSFSCIPLAVTESHTIFKSKITIINAYLPAELCSILPLIMRRIIASKTKFSLPKLTVGKIDSNLATISELTRCESPEFAKQISYDISKPKLLNSDKVLKIKSIKLFDCIVKPMTLLELQRNEPEFIQVNNSTPNHKGSCMAVQKYQPLNKIIQAYQPFNLEHYIENLINTKCLNLILKMPLTIHYFKIRCYNKNIAIGMGFENELSNINVKLMLSNVSMDSICNNLKHSIDSGKNIANITNDLQNGPKHLDICAVKSSPTIITEKRRSGLEFRLTNSKNKKKNFARLYKKCNSMSNLLNRSTVSIDKITNTDEFTQALGSSKNLSTVIDGNTERKILLSLKEMKKWMTDITPGQALLVLLLANKKDTPNVVRYWPVVLQGIAVNRITRSSELDMEIEVIERENLNKLKQYEGISYLPASVENQDSLLEELYWIAKTTASDYQKPFDESSERLLKSLLEKRKKLNPSYLRVMARYVGLGLLKTPK